MIGIVTALPAEARCLSGRRLAPGNVLPLTASTLICISGIGPAAAATATMQLREAGASHLLSWGTAAGLAPSLRPGSVLVPETVLAADGQILHAAAAWRERLLGQLLQSGLAVHGDLLAESEQVLQTPADKHRYHQHTGAVAADMESAAVARIAAQYECPFLAIRAVADPANTALPGVILDSLDRYGRPRIPALLSILLHQPGLIPELVRLGHAFRLASRSLRVIARDAGEALGTARAAGGSKPVAGRVQ